MLAGSVDLVLGLKGQQATSQGLAKTADSLGSVNKAATAAGEGVAKAQKATEGAAAATGKMSAQAASATTQTQALTTSSNKLQTALGAVSHQAGSAATDLFKTADAASKLKVIHAELARETEKTSGALSSAGKSAVGLVSSLKGFAVAGAAAMGLTFSAQAAIGFAKASAQAAMETQRTVRALEYATGSAEGGAAALRFVKDEAERLGLALPTASREFAKMSAAARGTALEGKVTRDIFIGVSEAATVLGLSADQTAGALNAIQQMISKGSVQAEELRGQLGERLYGAFQLAAKAMGVTTAQLGKMLEQGEVMATDLLPRFADELHNTFGEAAVDAAESAMSSFNRFDNAMIDLKTTLGEAVLPMMVQMANAGTKFIKNQMDAAASTKELRIEMARLRQESGISVMGSGLGLAEQAEKNLAARRALAASWERSRAMQQGDMENYSAPSAPAMNVALTKAQEETLSKLKHDAEKSRLESSLTGFALERALEGAHHREQLEKFAGTNALIEAENRRHISEMAKIKKEEADKEEKDALDVDERAGRADKAYRKRLMDQAAINLKTKQHENEKRTALELSVTKTSLELDKQVAQSKYALASELVNAMGKFKGAAVAAFVANKAIAVASIISNSMMAQAAASAPPPIGVGPLLAAPLIGKLQVLMGYQLATVAATALQGMDNGGIVNAQYARGDRNIIRANAREMFITQGQQAELWSFIKGGSRGGGDGGGGNTVHFTYNGPNFPAGGNMGGKSVSEMMRDDRVEVGRLINEVLKPKGYVK